MKKFLVLYLVPASVLEDWSKTDPEKRKVAEEKMRGGRQCVSVRYALCSSAFMSLMVEENARGGTAAPSP
jgi:hypothetical protein